MSDMSQTQKNWSKLIDIVENGIKTLPQLLVYQAERFGNRVLHRKKDFGIWQAYSWEDVLGEVKSIAMGLLTLGVKRDEVVAIVGENEPELFWSEYAAQCIGAKVVCLYPDLTASQMEYVLIHSEAVVAFCEDQEQVDKLLELEEKLPAIHRIIYWDDKGMWKYNHPKMLTFAKVKEIGKEFILHHPGEFEKEVNAGRGDDIAVISYTSGTTGAPKGCIITYNYLFDTAFRVAGAISMKPFTQYLSYISTAWSTEQMFGITMGLLIPFVVNFPEEPETVQNNIREIGVEALAFTPPQWESLASLVQAKIMDAGPVRSWFYNLGMAVGQRSNLVLLDGKKAFFGWRLLCFLADKAILRPLRDNLGLQSTYLNLSGGSGMSPDVFRFFHTMGVKLRNIFGITEFGLLTMHQGETYDLETVGKWLPVFNFFGSPFEFNITDKGELLVKGGSGFIGYYKDSNATSQKIIDGWFHTGDVVHMTDKNELVYLDRLADMRKLSTGHFFPPQFIENRLRFSAYIKNALILGDEKKPFVAAFIDLDGGTLGTWAEHHGISFSTFADLSQIEEIRELIRNEIKRLNYFLPDQSKVTRFINLPKQLDPDEDELTRSRKLRRGFLEQKYASFISAIYSGSADLEANVPIKYQDGRSGVLKAIIFINDLL
jgi:long-chain acyl-CoA synthetase